MAENAPAGWYGADGDPTGLERYWDGSLWTESTRPAAPPPTYNAGVGVPVNDEWNLGWWLFSFRGRAHRAHFWWGQLLALTLTFIVLAVGGSMIDSQSDSSADRIAVFFIAVLLVPLWVTLAVQVKRWHDRGKSGAFVLINLIPIVGIWALIECGFLEGTRGPNLYGAHRGPDHPRA
ncbi:MAG: DUF805 domain-containing protein [Acidimicrobiia bacterium]|nr:DUF805 domain-containing protein [Acidimicrobiia bacterium]